MCDIALEIDGKLDNEGSYYMESFKEIKQIIGKQANQVMAALTQNTNVVLGYPLTW